MTSGVALIRVVVDHYVMWMQLMYDQSESYQEGQKRLKDGNTVNTMCDVCMHF